ncbi:hypothetical protein [Novosphingobium sp.]|uniref:hypothetical protein n=1 Tax=Novosphingobium sp. TaxID=1874826 RepID=UPI001DAB7D1F|nr:hypothetical protein [Novosphingobium sp.]MBX9663759.1 hypothetical protein [Novosphingobium sp.]
MAQARKPWFAPKRYGYGAGLPIAWEGWAILIGYFASVIVMPRVLPPLVGFCVIMVLTAALLWICATRTAGGWRWRNGKD